jgi:hypothetical protein
MGKKTIILLSLLTGIVALALFLVEYFFFRSMGTLSKALIFCFGIGIFSAVATAKVLIECNKEQIRVRAREIVDGTKMANRIEIEMLVEKLTSYADKDIAFITVVPRTTVEERKVKDRELANRLSEVRDRLQGQIQDRR